MIYFGTLYDAKDLRFAKGFIRCMCGEEINYLPFLNGMDCLISGNFGAAQRYFDMCPEVRVLNMSPARIKLNMFNQFEFVIETASMYIKRVDPTHEINVARFRSALIFTCNQNRADLLKHLSLLLLEMMEDVLTDDRNT